jgi:membrane protein
MGLHPGHFKQTIAGETSRWIHKQRPAAWTRASHAYETTILFARRIWNECRIGEAMDMAARVSFYFALSCFPFLLVLAALLGWMHRSSSWASFWYWLTSYLPTSAQDTVLMIMMKLSVGFEGFLGFGLLLTFWSASTGFLSLMEALTQVYGGKETRSYLKRRAIAIVATIVAATFLLLCFGIWNVGHFVAGFIFQYSFYLRPESKIARWAVTLVMILIGVDLVNYFLPARRPPWRWVMPGSAFTVFCFVVASALLKLYVSYNHAMSRIYGALTGFIVMMLWIYLANLSVLIGAQTDAVVIQLKKERTG